MWDTHITVKKGDVLYQGSIFAEVPETRAIVHKPMVPPGIEGTVLDAAADGKIYDPRSAHHTITAGRLGNQAYDGTEMAYPHPAPRQQTLSGIPAAHYRQRILDTLFPLAKRRHRLYPQAASAQVKP